jgi:AcrR family transcriptional regulator
VKGSEEDALALGASRTLRRDAAANRQRLLDAAGEILRTRPERASMPSIAKLAGVGTATAYRFFPTLEVLLNSYLHGVVVQLRDYSHDRPTTGPKLFDDVLAEWLRLLGIYGPAMVQLRSRRGLLERLHARDPVVTTLRDAWERPIRAVMRNERIPDHHFEAALLLYNALFDPREVLDLLRTGMSQDELKARLTSAYKAAIRGWTGT